VADSKPSSVHLPVVPSDSTTLGASYTCSQLSQFERCPLSFALQRAERFPSPAPPERRLGVVLHRALEDVVREHVRTGRIARIDRHRATAAFQWAWAHHDLSDHALFVDGLDLVARWARREGVVAPEDVLGIAQEFEVEVGGVRVRGHMDQVDRIGEEAVRVRDYTSSRLPPRREDAEASLKLAIHDMAARQLWPWAKRVELAVDLLRHDVRVAFERTDAQREATREYVRASVAQMRRGEFPARPSTLCVHCDQRTRCPAYADARAAKRAAGAADLDDLHVVAREREELALLLKALGERKDVLDEVLRAELEQQPELRLLGHRYTLSTAIRREYPLEGRWRGRSWRCKTPASVASRPSLASAPSTAAR